MITKEFNVNEVMCSGFLMGAERRISEDNLMILQTFINTHLAFTPARVILKELIDSEISDTFVHIGTRVNDNAGLLHRMITGLIDYAESKVTDKELVNSWVNDQINKMTASEMIILLEKAIIDAASSDYYYEIEETHE